MAINNSNHIVRPFNLICDISLWVNKGGFARVLHATFININQKIDEPYLDENNSL
jgi:hypothetical protein